MVYTVKTKTDSECCLWCQDGCGGSFHLIWLSDLVDYKRLNKLMLGMKKGMLSFSLGYLFYIPPASAWWEPKGISGSLSKVSTLTTVQTSNSASSESNYLSGFPINADLSARLQLLNPLLLRPRLSFLGPATFNTHYTYNLNFTVGGGVDIIYNPFPDSKIKPVFALGGTAGYATGKVTTILDSEEPLDVFGVFGTPSLALIYNPGQWSLSLEGVINVDILWGAITPDISFSLLW